MEKDMQLLKDKFDIIKGMDWLPAPHNRNNEEGSLFERLLDKPEENFAVPDFEGIEIKTHISSSRFDIKLFTANPEGKEFFEVNRLCMCYGYPDYVIKTTRILYGDVSAKEAKKIGLWYYFKLIVNREEKRIYLCIYDHKGQALERASYWDFPILEEKLIRKLSYLAYVKAERKMVQGQYYFRYVDISFYKLKDFSTFLDLLEKGIITVNFSIGVFRRGKRMGQIRNHGIGFRIASNNLKLLFDNI